jgi:hypothetical protein
MTVGELAAKAARSMGYRNAGTMEFLFDQDGSFYFMEMNTRIQVEHPVTEEVTGLDLVKEQIQVAAGEKLSRTQEEIEWRGNAIECRINAEDHEHGFRPSPGKITYWYKPGGPGLRVDSHVYAGYTVPRFYDSMIGKLIAYGKDRPEALRRMEIALEEMIVEGVKTTIPFHLLALRHPRFKAGDLDTGFVAQLLQPAPRCDARGHARRALSPVRVRVSLWPGAPPDSDAPRGWPLEPRRVTAVAIDVLRATTTLTLAFTHGAARVIPVASIEEARAWKARDPQVLLCGERGGLKIPGFDLGNSPSEYGHEAVRGRTLVFRLHQRLARHAGVPGQRRAHARLVRGAHRRWSKPSRAGASCASCARGARAVSRSRTWHAPAGCARRSPRAAPRSKAAQHGSRRPRRRAIRRESTPACRARRAAARCAGSVPSSPATWSSPRSWIR